MREAIPKGQLVLSTYQLLPYKNTGPVLEFFSFCEKLENWIFMRNLPMFKHW